MTLYLDNSLEAKVIKFILFVVKDSGISMKENAERLLYVLHEDEKFIASGLCHVVRQIVKKSMTYNENTLAINGLLGYKQNCLKACAAVSCWTNFCESDFPHAIFELKKHLRTQTQSIELQKEFIKLEKEFSVPKKTPNATKFFTSKRKNLKLDKDSIVSHSNSDYSSLPEVLSSLGVVNKCSCESTLSLIDISTDLNWMDKVKSKYDIRWPYLCALNMTIADLIVYAYLLEIISELGSCIHAIEDFFSTLPQTLKWFLRCSSQDGVLPAARTVLKFENYHKCFQHETKEKFFHAIDGVLNITFEEAASNPKQMHLRIEKSLPTILESLRSHDISPVFTVATDSLYAIPWETLPSDVNPTEGELNAGRALRKRQQIQNMIHHIIPIVKPGDKVVDFCAGGGHLGIVIAYLRKDCHVTLLENKEESIERALRRIRKLGLTNITVYLSNLNYYHEKFDIGVTLHACGSATDLVLKKCIKERASFVICPCCYGSIRPTDNIIYPKSQLYSDLPTDDYFLLARSADQTSSDFQSNYSKQGKNSMLLIDYDRAMHVEEKLFCNTFIYSMEPETCSPKNNIIVGKRKK